jgi:light-regulated signal transduction histidine kinase (bacteriophytochrome)
VNAKECEECYARGLAFFGKISANVSHEVKNHLAVINEIGGLLQDLSVMAQKKDGLDPLRVEALSRNITDQIAQTDNIIKAFNYFSHSVDRIKAYVDLNEFAEIMVTITRRLSANKGTNLVFSPEMSTDLSLFTNPFLLEQLYHFCLEHIIFGSQSGLSVSVSAARTGTNGQLIFYCQDHVPGDIDGNGYLDFLMRELKAGVEVWPDRKKLVLTIKPLPA